MNADFDVIVVGSGPAGISAAFPLVESGLKLLMVDGGRRGLIAPPDTEYITARYSDPDQWKWSVGADFQVLRQGDAVSPKVRIPTLSHVFEGFNDVNRISSSDFVAVGSLAPGGLSNAWGCGTARLNESELAAFPFPAPDLFQSYRTVTQRMGVSGRNADDMAGFFGVDEWAQPAIEIDPLHGAILDRYQRRQGTMRNLGVKFGRSRIAVLSQNHGERRACDLSGNCFYGCHRGSLYTAAAELSDLRRHENFHQAQGFLVSGLQRHGDHWIVLGYSGDDKAATSFTAKRVLLAAGTLATTRFALETLRWQQPVRLLSSPTATFLLWIPQFFGAPRRAGLGMGQISYSFELRDDVSAYGSTFATTGIPVAEFLRHLPICRRYGIDLLREMLGSCVVGNLFLPGSLSASQAVLKDDASLSIDGSQSQRTMPLMRDAARVLRKAYRKLGAIALPGSFKVGPPGSDIHYAGTLPMKYSPGPGETDRFGEVLGLSGVHAIDGACLPSLSEKPHTLTIMANADRIGRVIASEMAASPKA